MKILSPAGNFESLKMAVFNGADEVYLGINEFNARNNIDGFDLDRLKNAVDFSHIYGVKVCLAINILFNDNEMQKALDVVVDAYNIGVDAFIIQDLGLAKLIFDNYPEIEIHASTQMGLHNLEGVQEILKYGFKRVVLARETPLNEIKRIKKNCNVEIEYFAQGALCVSFSGNCYLSSYLCNASGNRGRCKQLCRLPYTLLKSGKQIKTGYLLSAKDFNMINRLKDLEDAGVDVIKIEGRARRPFYVASTTREYYNAIHGKKFSFDNLKLAFNREYTQGYFDDNGNIISKFHNHIGIFVGIVEKFVKGKNFNEVYFSANRPLLSKSTFKFFTNDKETATISAYDLKEISKGLYKITTKQHVCVKDKVHLIADAQLEDETLKETKKQSVSIDIIAKENLPIKAVCYLPNKKPFEVYGEICEKAQKQPITIENLQENFQKSEFFDAILNIVELENVFMPKQKLNEFRRNVFDKIFEEITKNYYHNLNKIKLSCNYMVHKVIDFQLIESHEHELKSSIIIYSPSEYKVENIKFLQDKCNKLNKQMFLDTPNFALAEDIKLLRKIIDETGAKIVANNYYALAFSTDIIIGGGLNVYNKFTAQTFNRPVLTVESDLSTKIQYPYMTLRHCPMKSHLNANCQNCPFDNTFSYKIENGKTLRLKRKKLHSCTFYLTD